MMTQIVEFGKQLLSQNQLVSAIASGGLVVWLIANVKSIYYTIRNFIEDVISFTIHNIVEDKGWDDNWKQTAFEQILSEAKPIWERTVDFKLTKSSSYASTTYGKSIKLIYGKLCIVNRSYRISNSKNNIVTNVRVFFAFKKNFMEKLNGDIASRVKTRENTNVQRNIVNVYAAGHKFVRDKRKIDSIFTDNDVNLQAYEDIRKFIANKALYKKLNYPYAYCCCFYGPPGCGKTSTILAIASELNRDINYVNLAEASSYDLIELFSSASSSKTLFVFEDIDAACSDSVKSREKQPTITVENCDDTSEYCENASFKMQNSNLSLSDLLNITDGLMSNDGTICIFTTNHIEKLDPALLRSGRMNSTFEFKEMSSETASKMLKSYLGHDVIGLKNSIKPSDLQEAILNTLAGKMSEEDLVKKFSS